MRPIRKFVSTEQLQDSPNGMVIHFKVLSENFRPIKRFGRQMGIYNYTLKSGPLMHASTNPRGQIARAVRFCTVASNIYITCFESPFWSLEFWGGS